MDRVAITERIQRCMLEGDSLDNYRTYDYITLKCDMCTHQFSSRKHNLLNGNWCQYCNHGKLCDDISCIHCLNNSLQGLYPELINLSRKGLVWSEKNGLPPRYFPRSSNKMAILLCTVCNHETKRLIYTDLQNCNYCSSWITYLCGKRECKWCWDKSFAISPFAKYMIEHPWMYTKNSNKKCTFTCNKCKGRFQKSPRCMSYTTRCPLCRELLL